jgi:serine/threonine protein kinase
MTPNTIARFTVERRLGAGNQGTVYLCSDPELQRQVAIKLLDKTVLGSQEAAAAFHREARSMSRVQHPNIVTIHEAGRQDGVPFLVFEYVEGQLLSEAIQGGGLDVPRILELFQGLLEGMERAHRQGIVHRDLKPANIIISGEGVPKVMDFGIARVLSGQRDWDTQLIGSPRYMAPEYVERGEVGAQSDVFALGLILDEMITGMPVFQGGSQQEVLAAIVNDPVLPPSQFNQAVDERLDRIVLKALEKDPADRYADAGDFLHSLKAYRDSLEGRQSGAGDGHGTIDFLLRRMQRKSDFPALAQSIRTLNAMAATSDKDVSDMAKVIVKDFALANKILKVVNSAYFGHFAGKIGTISRAVVVLGMQPIRSLAASLIFFEHLHDRALAAELRAQTTCALYSAVLAGQLAAELDPELREEYFLSAMLQNLGAILVSYYLHDESREIRRLTEQGRPALQAQRNALGVSFEEVGIGIARQWNFPEDITRSLRSVPADQPVKEPEGLDERRRVVGSFANETAVWLGSGDAADGARRSALLARYGEALGIDGKKFNAVLATATKEFIKLVDNATGRGGDDPFVARLKGRLTQAREQKRSGRDSPDGTIADTQPAGQPQTAGLVLAEQPAHTGDSEALLTEGLQEVTNMLVNEPSLPELCSVVLETMYRAMTFQRVILCLKDRTGRRVQARLGFGNGVDAFLKGFEFPLTWHPDVFHAALKNGVDVYIANAGEPRVRKDLPPWFVELSDAGSFLVFPLVVRSKPLGLIYGDHARPDALQITGKTLNLLKALRNQIVLGFRERM